MDPLIRYYKWHLNDIKLCLASNDFSINSPTTFAIGDSGCKFFLQFSFHHMSNEISLFLYRCDNDGPTDIKVRFKFSLESANEKIFYVDENTCSFQKGNRKGFCTKITKEMLLKNLENKYDKDTLIVICETIDLQHSFKHCDENIRVLSEDLLQLLTTDVCSANAYLITDGCSFPVHKEILSAHTSVFERMFRTGECRFQTPFSPEVIKAMLVFLYSYDISKVNFDNVSCQQLQDCAAYYEISDLKQVLSPRMTYATSAVDCKYELHKVQFAHFTQLCKSLYAGEHIPVRMKFDENIEMRVKFHLESYNECGKITLETSLRNIIGVKGLIVRMFILDNFNTRKTYDEWALDHNEGTILFSIQYELGELFSKRNLILPKDILALEYELKFQLTGRFLISDPEVFEDEDYREMNRLVSTSLSQNMQQLLKSKLFTDSLLLLPACENSSVHASTEMSAHKSILSARSPVFKDKFRTDQRISMDLSAIILFNLVHYMYTGVLRDTRVKMLNLLHRAALTYQIDQLKHACEERVAKALNLKNVFSIYMIAFRGGNNELKSSCKDLILKNKDIILGSYRWEKFRTKNGAPSEEIKRYIFHQEVHLSNSIL